jgi:peptidoglycan/xylan/chitin deacetylase (PgdA/CDA1 family)
VSALDTKVVTVTREAFERQLELIKQHFDVVTIEQVADAIEGGAPLPRSPLLLTFDDGYRDNHDVALPLLRKHGLKATFFVATQFVDERRLFWWDRINFILKASTRPKVELAYPYRQVLTLGPAPEQRARAIKTAVRLVKEHFDLCLPLFLEHLGEAARVPFPRAGEVRLAEEHVMTWGEVRALRDAGMSVQSHTHTHRVIQTLSPAELDDELTTSRRLLEREIGEAVFAIAYPVGRGPACPRAVRDAVRRAGYSVAFSNHSGINPVSHFDELDAKRLTIDTSISPDWFEAIMAVPALAY